MIKEYFNQPYPLPKSKWKLIIFISLFVAIFMLVFQPFGLSDYQHDYKTILIAGYGLVCFIVLIFNLFIVAALFKKWFLPTSWTLFRQIVWLTWILFSIGIGNYLYSSLLFSIWSWMGLIVFQMFTLAVGIIPVVVLTVLQQNFMLSQNLKSAKEFNSQLNHHQLQDEILEKETISIVADNQKDNFKLALSDLLYIESTGNYIEIFYLTDHQITNTILRSTLKRTEMQLENHPSIVKCHRAFLVNVHKIKEVRGNSQGLRLLLKNTETEIPVSRNLSKSLKEKINAYV